MPSSQVMKKFSKGKLHSGTKKGPKVTDPKQALAIMYSEKRDEGSLGSKKHKKKEKKSFARALVKRQ